MSRLSRLLRHVTGLLPTAPAGPSDRELAETAEREGRLREAAAARVRLGEFGAAADLLDHAGDAGLAAVLRAQHCLGAGDLRGAAQALEVAADPDGCAALWRELGENERAAEVLERSGRWAQAAIAWEQCDGGERRAVGAWDAAGGHGRAADLLQRLGDRPAELIQRDKAEQWLRAGELRIAAGELAEAEDCLKRVAEQSPDWRAGRLLLGDVHELLDRPLEAATCYAQAIADEPVDARNVATYYLAGRCALDAGRPDLADTHLQVVFAYDSDYQDVGELLRTVDGAALHTGGGGPVSVASASGRFERGEELGAGGNGTVYRAKDTVLDREVAVKVLSPETAAVGEVRERFLREARSAAGLTHPNIVAVYDFGDDDGELFLAMELVEGRNLRQIVRSDGPLPSSMLRSVTEQACAALGYAHENGVVHRDVKPANLLWTDDRALKFTDFGLAKGLDGARSPDHGGDDVLAGPAGVWDASQSRVAGTPYYMAPEQVMRRRVTQAVDIYALGVTLFELATGELPFVEGNILRSHLQDRPPTPSALRPELPRWVDRVVERCMRKKPEERYATTEGVLAEIEAAAA